MTILTKPSDKKSGDKIPIADEAAMLGGAAIVPPGSLLQRQPAYNPDVDTESMDFSRRPSSFTCIKTLLLFLVSVGVMVLGILSGYTLYRMYAPGQNGMHYRALCDIPYSMQNNMSLPRFYASPKGELNWESLFQNDGADLDDSKIFDDLMSDKFFREELEFGVSDNENYAKINVPDFRDGRRGRFMHDFKENQSAIIDATANRCFVMPLDRETTMPPKSFMDLMQKMGSGYYNIDTDRVRRNMRVVMPPLTDMSLISDRIANECYDMKTYMLERYVSGVFKRSARALGESGKFAEFMGKGIVEFNIMNIAEIEEYERKQQQLQK